MERSIVFAGFGGQGVLTAGLIVANVAVQEGKEVLWMPAYGGQMRGGKSYSLVKMDDAPICHPDIEELDVLVAMNRPSLEGFSKFVKKGGLVLINSDTIGDDVPFEMEGVTSYRIPFATIARGVENAKGANIAALGQLLKLTGMFELETFKKGLLKYFEDKGKGAYAEKNAAALDAGYQYAVKA